MYYNKIGRIVLSCEWLIVTDIPPQNEIMLAQAFPLSNSKCVSLSFQCDWLEDKDGWIDKGGFYRPPSTYRRDREFYRTHSQSHFKFIQIEMMTKFHWTKKRCLVDKLCRLLLKKRANSVTFALRYICITTLSSKLFSKEKVPLTLSENRLLSYVWNDVKRWKMKWKPFGR